MNKHYLIAQLMFILLLLSQCTNHHPSGIDSPGGPDVKQADGKHDKNQNGVSINGTATVFDTILQNKHIQFLIVDTDKNAEDYSQILVANLITKDTVLSSTAKALVGDTALDELHLLNNNTISATGIYNYAPNIWLFSIVSYPGTRVYGISTANNQIHLITRDDESDPDEKSSLFAFQDVIIKGKYIICVQDAKATYNVEVFNISNGKFTMMQRDKLDGIGSDINFEKGKELKNISVPLLGYISDLH